jgi:hypothetical protein
MLVCFCLSEELCSWRIRRGVCEKDADRRRWVGGGVEGKGGGRDVPASEKVVIREISRINQRDVTLRERWKNKPHSR